MEEDGQPQKKMKTSPERPAIWSIVTYEVDDANNTRIRDYWTKEAGEAELQKEFKRVNNKINENHLEDCATCAEGIEICHCDSRSCELPHSSDAEDCDGVEQLEWEDVKKLAEVEKKWPNRIVHPYDPEASELMAYASDGNHWVVLFVKHLVF